MGVKRVENRKEKGFALIIVLWVVAIMGTITMLLNSQTRISLKINRNSLEGQQAALLAEAGIYHMIAELLMDDEQTTSDNKNESWYDGADLFYDIPMGSGVYRIAYPDPEIVNSTLYGAMDECGKLNINTATREQMLQLPNATEEIVDSIIDWRDEDSDPQPMGAESDYYLSLDEPFMAKNSLIDTLDELLIIKGMTLSVLYGEDTNLNGILDPNENDGAQQYPIDNSDGVLDRGWYPYITCYSYEKNVDGMGEARINVNTASEEQLKESFRDDLNDREIRQIINGRTENQYQTIAHVLDSGLNRDKWMTIADRIKVSDDEKFWGRININTASETVLRCLFPQDENLVQDIISYRESNEGPFENIGQLLNVEGVNNNRMKQIANLICTKSSVFSVRSAGYIQRSNAYKEIYAMIDRGGDSPQILYWKMMR